MRVASTGLGKSELLARIFDIKPEGDCLGLHSTTEGPEGCEGWHLETYIEPRDIVPLITGFLQPFILWTFVKSYLIPRKNQKEPETL